MEIDLELPSGEQDKLDSRSMEFDLVDGANHLLSSTISEHVKENSGLNMEENNNDNVNLVDEDIIGGENHVDLGTVQVDNTEKANTLEPRNGLEFESKEAAYSFYREYARSVGFGITIKASRRSKRSGKFIDVKIACSRFGIKSESNTAAKPKPCLKTDCKAGLHIKRRQDEKWVVYNFVKEHNHDICQEDFYNSLLGCNKKSSLIGCQKKGLQLVLDEEDVQLMLEHFMHMQDKNPNFFYAIDLNIEKRLKSVFWVDSKGRHDYSNFGDVVFFDTYYIKNKFRIPFVPIVGVNHHFQFLLLGCALIGEKTASTFVWLLKTWLKAVGGQCPRVVITDQDKVWKESITEVFPNARHCFCLWHVMSEIPEDAESVKNQHEHFMEKFNKCIYRSWTTEKFEKRWQKLLDRFDLKENQMFQSLYEDRHKWVPNYMVDIFLAGMSTDKRSDSIICFFDNKIHRETTFKEFLDSYQAFCHLRYEMETKADFEAQHKQPALKSPSTFEKQMSAIYTPALFKKFQVEALGAAACHVHKESEDKASVTFQVNDVEEHQQFVVAWNEIESTICCHCHAFEYNGFLCRHALLVLQMSGVSTIPSRYILKRWTKYAKTKKAVGEMSKRHQYRFQRFNDLCKRVVRLAEEGSLSQESYNYALQALEEALRHCVDASDSAKSVLDTNSFPIHDFLNMEEQNRSNNVAKASIKRKAYKKRKVRLELEGVNMVPENSSRQMEHNSRVYSIDDCYLPQQDAQEMDLGSRPPFLDGYYGAQQIMPRAVELNSMSPIPNGYYANQQGLEAVGQLTELNHYGSQHSMQGLAQLGLRASATDVSFYMHGSFQDMEKSVGSRQFNQTTSKHIQGKQFT